jgi:hypothetical protein
MLSGVKIQEAFKDGNWRGSILRDRYGSVLCDRQQSQQLGGVRPVWQKVTRVDRLPQSGNLDPLCFHFGASPETAADTKRNMFQICPVGWVSKRRLEVFRLRPTADRASRNPSAATSQTSDRNVRHPPSGTVQTHGQHDMPGQFDLTPIPTRIGAHRASLVRRNWVSLPEFHC